MIDNTHIDPDRYVSATTTDMQFNRILVLKTLPPMKLRTAIRMFSRRNLQYPHRRGYIVRHLRRLAIMPDQDLLIRRLAFILLPGYIHKQDLAIVRTHKTYKVVSASLPGKGSWLLRGRIGKTRPSFPEVNPQHVPDPPHHVVLQCKQLISRKCNQTALYVPGSVIRHYVMRFIARGAIEISDGVYQISAHAIMALRNTLQFGYRLNHPRSKKNACPLDTYGTVITLDYTQNQAVARVVDTVDSIRARAVGCEQQFLYAKSKKDYNQALSVEKATQVYIDQNLKPFAELQAMLNTMADISTKLSREAKLVKKLKNITPYSKCFTF